MARDKYRQPIVLHYLILSPISKENMQLIAEICIEIEIYVTLFSSRSDK